MKAVSAKDAKNRFGQLMDDAQREPVTIEKHGRPFAVVQSYEDYQIAQQYKLSSLRTAIDTARKEFAGGRGLPFDREAVVEILAAGRQRLSERDPET